MDRISALRNVEDALARFEQGECSLTDLEAEVRGVLRTYATDFDGELQAYRADGGDADGVVVLASSRPDARDRVQSLVESPGRFEVTPVDP
ncbi:hypothetical protein [Halomicrobium sp. LC1Hm]|uniref:DUF7854 family protein n=1 Tax=Halomicrobium sp. LC1Hm TaxID=2610902 RepID=UPI0012985335|nr:hypothetical protein [Halomicrobium sp. LC1Hm]QGA81263.1 hypothetical protein LC1Hm_0194 [Halomicrobium sp. LC1Hm]